jgi:hypothetical protein
VIVLVGAGRSLNKQKRPSTEGHGFSQGLRMLQDRLYAPTNNELIYHYCSSDAFVKIVSSRTMWLSAYDSLNDTTERGWGYQMFKKATSQLSKEIDIRFIEAISTMVDKAYSMAMTMIGSYSLESDALSQWRAYADDGRGFAIGFSPNQMEVPAKPLRVLYEQDQQMYELLGNIRHSYRYEKSIGFQYNDELKSHFYNIGLDLCAYKHPSFREEKEIRYVHVSAQSPEGKPPSLVSLGARDQNGKLISGPIKVQFRATHNGNIVPYVVIDYTNRGTKSPIEEIILGPRNPNSVAKVEVFLNTIGVRGAKVRRSEGTYR